MGWWPFGRRETGEKDVDRLLAEADAASPSAISSAAEPGAHGDGSFRMTVEDVFAIKGRGTVATGRVEAGTVSVGLQVQVVRGAQVVATTPVTGVEQFRARVERASVGENVGLLLAGLSRDQVQPGDLVTG